MQSRALGCNADRWYAFVALLMLGITFSSALLARSVFVIIFGPIMKFAFRTIFCCVVHG